MGDLGLNDGSTACKESDSRYFGIVITTLRDYFENYINEEQVVDSKYMIAIIYIVMGSRSGGRENKGGLEIERSECVRGERGEGE